ncbi:MAG: ABC transporter ATP-binding protein/permease [Chthoniobacterales bacterium]
MQPRPPLRQSLRTIFLILQKQIFPWWISEEKKIAWLGMISLVILSLASVYIAVLFNNWSRDFYNTLEQKNLDGFLHQVLIFIPLVAILLFDFCTRAYLTAWLSFRWRRWATVALQKKWLSNYNFYKIPLRGKEMDNPDQRISQDVREVCYATISIFLSFFREGVNFITFAIILWNLSKVFDFKMMGHSLHIPGLLVWTSILYSLIGTLVIFKVGGPIIDLDRIQEKREANFRYSLMRIFERREEIATFRGEAVEQEVLQGTFLELTKNYYQILKRQIYINLFQNFYRNASMFVPLFLVGPLYFKSIITMGVLMQTQGMFAEVNASLSSVMTEFQGIAGALASLKRLIAFDALMQAEEKPIRNLNSSTQQLHIPSFIIRTPTAQKIWTSPEIFLTPGDRKILMAPSGTGKTSFLRVISGIYPYVDGGLVTLDHDAMIIPQRPYMPVGTLRQCLLYPSLEELLEQQAKEEETLIALMKQTYLEHLIPSLDEADDYQNRLSLGEQQRINFLRVLLHEPRWLFMDEPFSQLNKEYSKVLLQLLTSTLQNSGIFIVSHQEIPGFEKVYLC